MEKDEKPLKNDVIPNKRKSPFDFFFSLGDKATKGDPVRKANFDYFLLWIMFLAFVSVLVSNFSSFIKEVNIDLLVSLKYLGWSGVMIAILWFQYFSLRAAYEGRKMMLKLIKEPNKELKIESVEEMLKNFKEEEGKSVPELQGENSRKTEEHVK